MNKRTPFAVFIDFDRTLTQRDVLDDVIQRFSINPHWKRYETLWRKGKIGSKTCLREQLKAVRVTKRDLTDYLSHVQIDPHTRPLLEWFQKKGIRPVILSDSFSYFIRVILKEHGIQGVKVFANKITFRQDRLLPSFPYVNGCRQCAHCKKEHLLSKQVKDKFRVYIGDGLSDICPAKVADLVFAKDDLLNYMKKEKRFCLPFKNFKDIHLHFKRMEQRAKNRD